MKHLLTAICASISLQAMAIEHDFNGSVLLRYENESSHNNIADRERIRTIANAGIKSTFNQNWSSEVRISTGLKNKQNVPAITIHRFNQQKQPDSDLFIDRFYAKGKFNNLQLTVGKIPWQTKQVTDVFWDRHLNPIGVHLDYRVTSSHDLKAAFFLPLDGQSDTIGSMSVVQWNAIFNFGDIKWTLSPWYVSYSGEQGAEFAKRDTQLDNQFVRLSSILAWKKFRLGVDLGRSLESFEQPEYAQFKDEKTSYAVEFRYGGLKNPGQYLAQLRYLHVERFAVVSEFAQNAVARFATSNIEGWDFRLRRKMDKNWWLGMRASDISTLVGAQLEEGLRFRIEAKVKF